MGTRSLAVTITIALPLLHFLSEINILHSRSTMSQFPSGNMRRNLSLYCIDNSGTCIQFTPRECIIIVQVDLLGGLKKEALP
jgi:hypothetical protein